MRFIDPHIHMSARTTDDYERMAAARIVAATDFRCLYSESLLIQSPLSGAARTASLSPGWSALRKAWPDRVTPAGGATTRAAA